MPQEHGQRLHKTTIDISRKGSIVKERCRQLCDIVTALFPEYRVSHGDLTDLVKMYIGADKETVRAYLGYQGKVVSHGDSERRILGEARKGYLEIFGFAHKVKWNEWFIHAQRKLQECAPVPNTNESLEVSNEKISISPIAFSQGERARENRFEKVVSPTVDISTNEKTNNNTTERERNFQQLSESEDAILTAKPIDSEPDRSKLIDTEPYRGKLIGRVQTHD